MIKCCSATPNHNRDSDSSALFIILNEMRLHFPTHSKLCSREFKHVNGPSQKTLSILCFQRPYEDIALCQVNTWEDEKGGAGLLTFYFLISFGPSTVPIPLLILFSYTLMSTVETGAGLYLSSCHFSITAISE